MSEYFYSKDCLAVSREDTCPLCRRTLRFPALAEDLCCLAELGPLESELLAQVLEDQGIPFHRQSTSGLVPVLGSLAENWRFFVHWANLERARALLASLNAGAEEAPAADPEE